MDSDWKLIRLVWSTSNAIKSIWVKSFVITPDFIESIIWRYFYHFVPFFVPFVLLFGLLFIGRRILTREISVRLLYVCAQRSRQNSHSVFFISYPVFILFLRIPRWSLLSSPSGIFQPFPSLQYIGQWPWPVVKQILVHHYLMICYDPQGGKVFWHAQLYQSLPPGLLC